MASFTHLHVHTQYSLLDGAGSIERLLKKAKDQQMNALAITDHGNMYGVMHFFEQAKKIGIKPLLGCEFYCVENRFDRIDRNRYHLIIIAKNEQGYKNLSQLSSLSFIDGFFYKPRIDKEILRQYHEGLICTSACMGSQINRAVLDGDEALAEKYFLELYEIFQDDFYLELQRFNNDNQEKCNQFLLKLSKKYNVKIIATNDVHYVNREEAVAHDILLCIQTGKDFNDPTRMRFCSDTFYLKSTEEMLEAFKDLPEAIYNTQEIVDKCWEPNLHKDIVFPNYQIPAEYSSQSQYLQFLTWSGANKRYNGNIPSKVEKRLQYELDMIHNMGFDGYFLIVLDYIQAAKDLGVMVGPGRGSVSGSLVAYCIGITDVNPLTYGLFFERFLNPERISMPDIDVDFEDDGREKVIEYVKKKYGREQVAHLITFGTMAAKVAIKDVARVLGLPFEQSNKLTKFVPAKMEASLAETIKVVPELKALYDKKDSLEHKILEIASVLEGCKRQTGIHACGIIIAPGDLKNYIPVKVDKETDLFVTQYEGSLIEHAGMLKMDFLGLKTLTIIKNTLRMVKKNHNVDLNIDTIPLDDEETFKLFQRGDTIGVFQFESEGMRQSLYKLKPTCLEDIIAMNALYRPGPMQFIPEFIDRKHGVKAINYPHPSLKDVLQNTYGIIVYQEQVMQVAQVLAGYSMGQADILRKAMGKKKPEEMAKQKEIFVKGCKEHNDIDFDSAVSLFETLEKFAQYGFNKAHAAAYSIIAFQTGYLKAHYPVEYMSAMLTNEQNDITQLSFYTDECKRMGIKIIAPNVNESNYDFDANEKGEIVYGLGGIKGLGLSAATNILQTREKHGKFKDIFDFAESIELKTVNKKSLESLTLSGAFDCFENTHRRQYLYVDRDVSFIEKLIEYVGKLKDEKDALKNSLFGDSLDYNYSCKKPTLPVCDPYSDLEMLELEKEYVGLYLSGHPLNLFEQEIKNFCSASTKTLLDENKKNKSFAGIITKATTRLSKKNNTPFMMFTVEDFEGEANLIAFGNVYNEKKEFIKVGALVYIVGEVVKREDVKDFKIKNLIPLEEVRQTMCKNVKLYIDLRDLSKEFIANLKATIKENEGNTLLSIEVSDGEMKKEYMSMYRVNVSEKFLQLISKYGRYEVLR